MALVNPNIALGIRQPEFTPRNAMAEYAQMQQVMNAQDAQQMNALKMQEAQATMQERNALRRLNPSASDFEDQLFRLNPTLGIQYRKERTAAEASAAATAASRAAAEKSGFDLSASRRKFGEDLKRGLSANPSDENIVAFGQDAVLQGLYSKDQVEATVSQLLAMSPAERVRVLSQSGASAEALKPSIQQVNRGGQTDLVRVPAFGGQPTVAGTYADVALPAEVQAQNLQRSAASAPNITVSTGKKYGEQFGGLIAEQDSAALATAKKAPQLASSANRIIDLVQQGNVFTGPIADVKLNIARALNVAGANNQEKIANTENLIAATGQSTLDAIKGAGLGTGQGFTNKDLTFLQGIAGGTINLTSQTLTELARLQHLAATRSAEAWNKRSLEIPREVLQGVGVSTTPITIPPLAAVKKGAATRPAGVGDNWTLERDAAGNTAWVSPDRKSFKEAK
jgi:hypothetical protein